MGKDRNGNLIEEFPLIVNVSGNIVSSSYHLNIKVYEMENRQITAHYICEKSSSGKGLNIKGKVYLSDLGKSKLKVKIRKDLTMRLGEFRRNERGY